jgi:hypothetical protein
MDAVYLSKDGENPELRYSLRTLERNVPHDTVWVFGGAPTWLNPDTAIHIVSPQQPTPYSSTRKHLKAALDNPDVSDPFMLWNDDFYAMQPVVSVPPMHRGRMSAALGGTRSMTPWFKGLQGTMQFLNHRLDIPEPLSYDLHVPIVVKKDEMREALNLSKSVKADAVHLRSIYGNLARLGGSAVKDPKMVRRNDPFPRGPWLSSSPDTFRSTVEPVLRYLFPDSSIYERI